MLLIPVDIGNSSTKFSLVPLDSGRWSQLQTIWNTQPFEIELPPDPVFWTVCSVNRERQQEMESWIQMNRPGDRFHVIQSSEVPLRTNVESRDMVGRDRLVAAMMAILMNDQSGPVVVVDAGTAVTVDWVDSNNRFQGGKYFSRSPAVAKTPV